MTYVQFSGSILPGSDILQTLYAHGYRLVLEPHLQSLVPGTITQSPLIMLLALQSEPEIRCFGHRAQRQTTAWLGWNPTDDPALTLAAYAAGAQAVLPAAMTASMLLQSIERSCTSRPVRHIRSADTPGVQRTCRRGEAIQLAADEVIDVVDGVVAQTVFHSDGSEVLIGLSGPGQLLIAHPDDACCLQLRAHTNALIMVRSWQAAATTPHFLERLRARVRLLEGWSAMQARPHLDERIIGILSVLAEQFGVPHTRGLLVDLRITHAQLAAAVGTTRSTVTRLLGHLRVRGILDYIGQGESGRFCLCRWEQTRHTECEPMHLALG